MSTESPAPPGPNARIPLLAACLAVGVLLGGLLVGYEPVGGDPDRIFRPIKAELASSLKQGTLPFWSEKLGLGVPLVAESHVAAFYPLNWLFYSVFSVSAAYRLSMWLHYLALAAAVFAYAREIDITPWGAAIASVAFTLCGFQTIHSSHEWAYHTLPYLPLCLLAADKYATTGRIKWLGGLGLLWGAQITLGHFQIQMWTGALAFLSGTWRVVQNRQPIRRIFGLGLALILALGVAMVQLVPSFELAQIVGQLNRSIGDLASYSYPTDHWNELAVPGLFRGLAGGPEARYWFSQDTTGYEACLFVGTLPLILAFIGFLSAGRGLAAWRVFTILSLALATMPRWWPEGYVALLRVPGFGLFRCPARYTVITSFGLCLLAGRGLDQTINIRRFRIGLALAGLFAMASFVWAFALPHIRPAFRPSLTDGDIAIRVGIACITWTLAIGMLGFWRRKANCAWILLAFTALEMGAFYHFAGTTHWGWSVPLPEASNVLNLLAKEPGVGRVGGSLDNLPVRAGLATANPYTGFPLPMPNKMLKAALDPHNVATIPSIRWLRRYGVTHLVWDEPLVENAGVEIFHGEDLALDRLTIQKPGVTDRRDWRIFRLPNIFPPVRLAFQAFNTADPRDLDKALSSHDGLAEAWYLSSDAPTFGKVPRATTARIVTWEGLSGEVEHDGGVDLILCRASYPGWEVTINGVSEPALRCDGGLLAAYLDSTGVSKVSFRYKPTGMNIAMVVSAIALLICIVLIGSGLKKRAETVALM